MSKLLLLYLAVVNVTAFVLYGADKRKAEAGAWRTPEATLVGIAWAGGALGALAGMKYFHHKTRKLKFQINVPLALAVWMAGIAYATMQFFL